MTGSQFGEDAAIEIDSQITIVFEFDFGPRRLKGIKRHSEEVTASLDSIEMP